MVEASSQSPEPEKQGELTIVGTGYLVARQITPEALSHLERADKLFHVAGDGITEHWLAGLHPNAESLADAYGEGKSRSQSYREMVERILEPVRLGQRVCVALYGHPGVAVTPSHDSDPSSAGRRASGDAAARDLC